MKLTTVEQIDEINVYQKIYCVYVWRILNKRLVLKEVRVRQGDDLKSYMKSLIRNSTFELALEFESFSDSGFAYDNKHKYQQYIGKETTDRERGSWFS